MALFNDAPQLSERCRLADPMNRHYCQILGDYRMELPHLNIITDASEHTAVSLTCMTPRWWTGSSSHDPWASTLCESLRPLGNYSG